MTKKQKGRPKGTKKLTTYEIKYDWYMLTCVAEYPFKARKNYFIASLAEAYNLSESRIDDIVHNRYERNEHIDALEYFEDRNIRILFFEEGLESTTQHKLPKVVKAIELGEIRRFWVHVNYSYVVISHETLENI